MRPSHFTPANAALFIQANPARWVAQKIATRIASCIEAAYLAALQVEPVRNLKKRRRFTVMKGNKALQACCTKPVLSTVDFRPFFGY
jgi:uncharacterized protein involved in response to NO